MPDLRAAYRVCREVNAAHGKSFYRATSLLPPSRRPHVWALYAVARRSDDLVDRPEVAADPAAGLTQWRSAVLDAITGTALPRDPVLQAVQHTVATFAISSTLFEEFFAAMRQDLTTARYQRWTDLRAYMRGSAAAIGEMTAPILGGDDSSLPFAAALGEAFQLTNFIRDVAEDWQRGRIYLPLEDFAPVGLSLEEFATSIATGTTSPALRGLLAFETRRARELYAAAEPGLTRVDRSVRPCLRGAIGLYGAILDQIERNDFEVCRGRTVVPVRRRSLALGRALSVRHPARTTSARRRS